MSTWSENGSVPAAAAAAATAIATAAAAAAAAGSSTMRVGVEGMWSDVVDFGAGYYETDVDGMDGGSRSVMERVRFPGLEFLFCNSGVQSSPFAGV